MPLVVDAVLNAARAASGLSRNRRTERRSASRRPAWRAGALFAATALVLLAKSAVAADWVVDEGASAIGFEYMRAGQPAPGLFHQFHGTGSFDPANPAAARLTLTIESSSIDLHDRLASAFATSAEWFDSKEHPEITYELARLEPLGGTHYRSEGFLSIRGKKRPITSEIDLTVMQASATARGTLEIDRRPYLLGVGPSAAFVEIGPQVEVSFDLRAQPTQ